MAHQDTEIEIKFHLKNPEQLARELDAKASPLKREVHQRDVYYNAPHRDFVSPNYPYEWLRLRETRQGATLTYKHFYPEDTEVTDYCDEFETRMDNPEAFRKLLKSLNFPELLVVEKTRTAWEFKDVEIAIDLVNDLGSFLELEATRPFSTPREAKGYLYGILSELGADVGEEDLRGYPYLLLKKRGLLKQ